MLELDELKRALDEGLINQLEYDLKMNLARLDLLKDVIRLQKKLLNEQRSINCLERQLSERKFFFNAALRDLDRLEAVQI